MVVEIILDISLQDDKGAATKENIESSILREKIINENATVERIEYDPNRTANIALIKYENGRIFIYHRTAKTKNW